MAKTKEYKMVLLSGSPRPNGNTFSLLSSIAEGVVSVGGEVKIIKLYDNMSYTGCLSCFACKKGRYLETCERVNDNWTPLLKEILTCNSLVIGSPVYMGHVSSGTWAFLERYLYTHVSYGDPYEPKPINTLFLYTMNRSLVDAHAGGYTISFQRNKEFLRRIHVNSSYILVPSTAQWDYLTHPTTKFNPKEREEWRKNTLPVLRKLFFQIGKNMVSGRHYLNEASLKKMQSILSANASNIDSIYKQNPILHISSDEDDVTNGGNATFSFANIVRHYDFYPTQKDEPAIDNNKLGLYISSINQNLIHH